MTLRPHVKCKPIAVDLLKLVYYVHTTFSSLTQHLVSTKIDYDNANTICCHYFTCLVRYKTRPIHSSLCFCFSLSHGAII
jgi:hypothetical protein